MKTEAEKVDTIDLCETFSNQDCIPIEPQSCSLLSPINEAGIVQAFYS